MALLALAGALLTGSMAAARSAARAAKSYEASLIAESEARVTLANVVQRWSAADDSIPVGTGRVTTAGPRIMGTSGATVVTTVRIQRLSDGRYVIATECQVGADSAVLARRRLQLVLERPAVTDSATPVLPPAPIVRWSMSELFL